MGRCGKYYIFIRARKHYVREGFEKYMQWWTAHIWLNKGHVASEGIFGSSLRTIKKAKNWVKQTIHHKLKLLKQ